MRSQFSIEFVIDVSFILVIIAFLIVFFVSFSNTHSSASSMSNICAQIANGINTVVASGGLPVVSYIPLLNNTAFQNYNISVSDGVIVIYLLSSNGVPAALISNTNVVSCGANTLATANESFGLSNLAIYQNNSAVELAYLYGNYTNSAYPLNVHGGGFSGNTSLYLVYPNQTRRLLAYETSPFSYSSAILIEGLPTGNYQFYASALSNSVVAVSLPFSKT